MAFVSGTTSTGSLLINNLRSNPTLDSCEFRHTALYNQGCEELFQWLMEGDEIDESQAQFPRSFDSLSLSDVHMGDRGFQALVDWLKSMKSKSSTPISRGAPLIKLNLRFNEIEGTAELAESFISALCISPSSMKPFSTLSMLVLSNNPLSSSFKATLFELLPNLPSLRQLHLTMTGLDKTDAAALAAYVGDEAGRCHLTELHANANNMGYSGVRAVIAALQRCWSMERVDMYSNSTEEPEPGENEDNTDYIYERLYLDDTDEMISSQEAIASYAPGSGCGWARLQRDLKLLLNRNMFLKRETMEGALRLLKYSRIMLQLQKPVPVTAESDRCADCDCTPQPSAQKTKTQTIPSSFSFSYLPTEIKLQILSALAPVLSPAQRIRIFEYAVDPKTLPSLRLCLPSSSKATICVADPGSLGFNSSAGGIKKRPGKKVGTLKRQDTHSCSSGTCMGGSSVVCHRETTRQEWLALVGCDRYDPGSKVHL